MRIYPCHGALFRALATGTVTFYDTPPYIMYVKSSKYLCTSCRLTLAKTREIEVRGTSQDNGLLVADRYGL